MEPEGDPPPAGELQERIYRILMDFPQRLEAMETRSEENCRVLAWHLARLFERELERRRRSDGD